MARITDRREFLRTSAALSAGVGLCAVAPGRLWAAAEPLYKISLAQWSLHRTLRSGKLDNLDFPKFTKTEFGIDAVEYVNQFFKDKAEDRKYIAELKQRSDDLGVRNVLIMIDGEGAIGNADEAKRTKAVENHYPWIDAAKSLGCHSIRVNASSSGNPDEQRDRAADGLRRIAEFGASRQMGVIVENHGGLSSNGAWLASVIRQVNLPNCGTLPDFGNFNIGRGKTYDRYQGVTEMMPFAKAVSAKSYKFDAQGNEVRIDFPRMMKIVLAAGYHGYIGIEWEGNDPSEVEGIHLTQRLLEPLRDELSG